KAGPELGNTWQRLKPRAVGRVAPMALARWKAGFDRHSRRACLLSIELEGRPTIQARSSGWRWSSSERTAPSGLGQLQIEDLVARRVPSSRFDDDLRKHCIHPR